MGLGYLLPGQSLWNPLGSWAASLPSALSSVGVMLALAATLLRWPQPSPAAAPKGVASSTRSALTAFSAALAFALSPLVLIWSRVAVSDSLFTGTLALSLLLFWRRYAESETQPWWPGWLLLGLAVLTKGPVALVLVGLTLALFACWQGQTRLLIRLWRPWPGLLISAAVALPWYGAELLVEGEPFWQSFFGYHNLQRFTSVVNHHLQPWWFFVPMLVVASLPFTPLLVLGLAQALISLCSRQYESSPWCVGEVAIAVKDGKTVIPIHLADTAEALQQQPLPLLLQDRQAIQVVPASAPTAERLAEVKSRLRRALEQAHQQGKQEQQQQGHGGSLRAKRWTRAADQRQSARPPSAAPRAPGSGRRPGSDPWS